jgi:hypothetical protein
MNSLIAELHPDRVKFMKMLVIKNENDRFARKLAINDREFIRFIERHRPLSDSGLESLKNWVASGNLATISVDANQYSNLTSNDVWTLDTYVNPSENHANTVVGYDDNYVLKA